jgi:2'-5' RNA ligase
MSYVLELQFESTSEVFVTNLMRQIKELGLPSNFLEKAVPPHLTLLASGTRLNQGDLEKLELLLEWQSAFSLSAVSLGTFANEQGVLYLGVVVSQMLLEFHSSIYDCLDSAFHPLHPYYLPGRWVPHLTVVSGLSREQLAVAVAGLELGLPVELSVSRLALVKYPAPLEQLKSWTLKKV